MRLIDADAEREGFMEMVYEQLSDDPDNIRANLIIDYYDSLPTVELPVRGEWKYFKKQNKAVCSQCSFERDLDCNFGSAIACPNCGASMKEKVWYERI